ncbi:DsrE family protein [Luteolibacter yonseiensis]|uniref:DsrE family protein n=1 Tax=Luteolibacter yonseiensis TaxID=1144680 RepID=A0A934R403_9BACT|nr:DsrE family protein [Luteolibacter yonseiensis]MBK1817983.1 DsrE family protein [Luteolibacter yonseiensis]
MKTAIIIISDPKAGEEAFARAFNALALASESKRAGDEVEVAFIGTGTRWPAELAKITNPANGLYNEVRDVVAGASRACAEVFGAKDGISACGIDSRDDNPIAGTSGVLSLRHYLTKGWQVLVF